MSNGFSAWGTPAGMRQISPVFRRNFPDGHSNSEPPPVCRKNSGVGWKWAPGLRRWSPTDSGTTIRAAPEATREIVASNCSE